MYRAADIQCLITAVTRSASRPGENSDQLARGDANTDVTHPHSSKGVGYVMCSVGSVTFQTRHVGPHATFTLIGKP